MPDGAVSYWLLFSQSIKQTKRGSLNPWE